MRIRLSLLDMAYVRSSATWYYTLLRRRARAVSTAAWRLRALVAERDENDGAGGSVRGTWGVSR